MFLNFTNSVSHVILSSKYLSSIDKLFFIVHYIIHFISSAPFIITTVFVAGTVVFLLQDFGDVKLQLGHLWEPLLETIEHQGRELLLYVYSASRIGISPVEFVFKLLLLVDVFVFLPGCLLQFGILVILHFADGCEFFRLLGVFFLVCFVLYVLLIFQNFFVFLLDFCIFIFDMFFFVNFLKILIFLYSKEFIFTLNINFFCTVQIFKFDLI